MKVLMLGNSESVKGGITSVMSQIKNYDWEQVNVQLDFIPTFVDKKFIVKLLFFIWAYVRIFCYIMIHKPDIVYIHMSYRGSFYRKNAIHRMCKAFGVKDIIHLHGSEFKVWYDSISNCKKREVKKLLRECNGFIVLGEKWKETVCSIEPKTPIIVLGNTVKQQRTSVTWNTGENRILFMGVLLKRKGVDSLQKAVKLLKDRGIFSGWKLVIAGTGDELENLKKQSVDIGIDSCVEYTGWVDGEKKENLLANCQIMVLPSYNEGLPVSILEAMSYGMPVISTKVGDIAMAVRDGENGYLVTPGNEKELALAIGKLIQSAEKWRIFSENSKKIFEECFNEKNYYQNLLKLWERILKKQ